jgi:hypothetical protein
MGETLLLQAARIAHFANGLMLRVTVFDPEAAKRQARLLQRYPSLPEVCDIDFVDRAGSEPEVVETLAQFSRENEFLVTYAFCFTEEAKNLSLALRVLPKLGEARSPILVRTRSIRGLGSLSDLRRGCSMFPLLPYERTLHLDQLHKHPVQRAPFETAAEKTRPPQGEREPHEHQSSNRSS